MPELRAGWAKREITPDPGYGLSGYAARHQASTGVLDPLYVRVILLEQEQTRAAIVLMDVLLISSRWADHLRRTISGKLNVPAEFVIVAATHTHSGPILDMHPFDFSGGFYEPNLEQYIRKLEDIVVATISEAESRLENVKTSFVRIEIEDVASDRNRPRFWRRQNLYAFRFDGIHDSALLAIFGCHPTILGAENRKFSGDLHGEVSRVLEKSSAIALVANGAAANISTRFTRRQHSPAELKRLATTVTRQVSSARFKPLNVSSITACAESILLPLADLETELPSPSHQTGRGLTLFHEALDVRKQLSRAAEFAAQTLKVSVIVWRIGPITVAALPWEIYSSTGEFLWAQQRIIPLCYANGYWGYLPPSGVAANDYEVLSSPFAREADAQLRKSLVALRDCGRDVMLQSRRDCIASEERVTFHQSRSARRPW